ncbi:MAG TPA: D-glycero-beta-D-manno-heptose 1-phosphate adenylyltransferase [Chitinispirillaceae bacterium]|nr:D-glycero-beta-D-manno-heptose 1-phosphate adenylyltransferase [Chitinispirillaceae bacterium]
MSSTEPLVFKCVEDVLPHIVQLRESGKTIVTTNGCFDLIHSGHVKYLSDAAAKGDALIVGINSDSSVSRLKGPKRPVQGEFDRAYIIAALKSVECAFIFQENDPIRFLSLIKPDIHVKGGDYTPEQLPERPIVEQGGGRIEIVSFLNGYSTTNIVKKILSNADMDQS